MASSQITARLSSLESTSNPQQRAQVYADALQNIISAFSGSDLSANLIAYVQSILSDAIGVIHSRPLLSGFVDKYKELQDNEVKIETGTVRQITNEPVATASIARYCISAALKPILPKCY